MKRGPGQNEARPHAAAGAAATDSQTRTIERPLANLANPAGSFEYNYSAASLRATLRRSDGNYIPKTSEGIEETGKTTREGGTPRAKKARQARAKRSLAGKWSTAARTRIAKGNDWRRLAK